MPLYRRLLRTTLTFHLGFLALHFSALASSDSTYLSEVANGKWKEGEAIISAILRSTDAPIIYFGESHNVGDNRILFLLLAEEYARKNPQFFIATESIAATAQRQWDDYVNDDRIPILSFKQAFEEKPSEIEKQHLLNVASRAPIPEYNSWIIRALDGGFIRALRTIAKRSQGKVSLCGIDYPVISPKIEEWQKLKRMRMDSASPRARGVFVEMFSKGIPEEYARSHGDELWKIISDKMVINEDSLERDILMASQLVDCAGTGRGLVQVGAWHGVSSRAPLPFGNVISQLVTKLNPKLVSYSVVNLQVLATPSQEEEEMIQGFRDVNKQTAPKNFSFYPAASLPLNVKMPLDKSKPFSRYWDGFITGPDGFDVGYDAPPTNTANQ